MTIESVTVERICTVKGFENGLRVMNSLLIYREQDIERFVEAFSFAKERHGDQKWGPYPYLIHLVRVFEEAERYTRKMHLSKDADKRANILIAALLHDVVEDTEATIEEVAQKFGNEVAEIVAAVTDPLEGTREEKKEIVFKRISVSMESSVLKLCDRLVNVSMTVGEIEEGVATSRKYLNMYQKEQLPLQEATKAFSLARRINRHINAILFKGSFHLVLKDR